LEAPGFEPKHIGENFESIVLSLCAAESTDLCPVYLSCLVFEL